MVEKLLTLLKVLFLNNNKSKNVLKDYKAGKLFTTTENISAIINNISKIDDSFIVPEIDIKEDQIKQKDGSVKIEKKVGNVKFNFIKDTDFEMGNLGIKASPDSVFIQNFNATITELSKMSADHNSAESAKYLKAGKEHERFDKLKKDFLNQKAAFENKLRAELINSLKSEPDQDKVIAKMQEFNLVMLKKFAEIDTNLKSIQFMNAHPEVSSAILTVGKEFSFTNNFIKSDAAFYGAITVGSIAARKAGIMAGPLVAAIAGGIRGFFTGKKNVREKFNKGIRESGFTREQDSTGKWVLKRDIKTIANHEKRDEKYKKLSTERGGIETALKDKLNAIVVYKNTNEPKKILLNQAILDINNKIAVIDQEIKKYKADSDKDVSSALSILNTKKSELQTILNKKLNIQKQINDLTINNPELITKKVEEEKAKKRLKTIINIEKVNIQNLIKNLLVDPLKNKDAITKAKDEQDKLTKEEDALKISIPILENEIQVIIKKNEPEVKRLQDEFKLEEANEVLKNNEIKNADDSYKAEKDKQN